MLSRLSIGSTKMGGRNEYRLPRPMGRQGSMESTNTDHPQSLFRPLDRPKLQEFDEISEIPEIMEESVFVGMNTNN